jgi:triacylglycerol lipase
MNVTRFAMGFAIAQVLALLVGAQAAGADPTPQLPVPYGQESMIRQAVTDWNGIVPGANDQSCKPSAAHPNPVVLVTSTFLSDGVNWTTLGPYLHNQGYCVFTFDYGHDVHNIPPGLNGMDPIPASAQTMAAAVDKVLASTGAAKVDLVGHSQGGVVSRYYINALGGAEQVDKMVLLSSPYSSTGLPIDLTKIARDSIPKPVYDAILYNGVISPTLLYGANFADPWVWGAIQTLQPDITYTQITDIADEAGLLGGMQAPVGASNATTRYIDQVCPTDFSQHFAQPYSPTAVAMIASALDPTHPVTAPCTVVPLYSF